MPNSLPVRTALALSGLVLLLPTARAAETSSAVSDSSLPPAPSARWNLLLEGDLGTHSVSGSEYQGNATGSRWGVGAGIARETPDWNLEGLAGWIKGSWSGKRSDSRDVDVRFRSGTASLGAYWRFHPRFEIGPEAIYGFGTDTSRALTVGSSSGTWSTGARLMGRFGDYGDFRFWQRIATDLSSAGGRTWIGAVGIQWAIPVRVAQRALASNESPSIAHASAAAETASDRITTTEASTVRIVLDPGRIFFGTASSQVKPQVARALAALGEELSREDQAFTRIRVEGHADQRGSYSFNFALSGKRAGSVRDSLISKAPPLQYRVGTESFSWSRPADPSSGPRAWARNRRVELVFEGVQDPDSLNRKLAPLLQLTEAVVRPRS